MSKVDVIIPAYNEQDSIASVLEAIPKEMVKEVIVVDNNSTDATSEIAKNHGATVLFESYKGYGAACLKGISYLGERNQVPECVVFLDADYSDFPEEMLGVSSPVLNGHYDLVIGSRTKGKKEEGSMLPQQVFGNWLATSLMRILYKSKFTDLGPFRAISWQALNKLKMEDRTFGWTVEMQIKALRMGLNCIEVPVSYRKRVGVSKITGTVYGTVMAGYKILYLIFKYSMKKSF